MIPLTQHSGLLNEFRENPRPEWFYPAPAKSGGGSDLAGIVESIDDNVAQVRVETAPCDRAFLLDSVVEVTDHSRCFFKLNGEEVGLWVWATEQVTNSIAGCKWSAINICCPPETPT